VRVDGEVCIVWVVIKRDVGLWADFSRLNNSLAAACDDGKVVGMSEQVPSLLYTWSVSHYEPVVPVVGCFMYYQTGLLACLLHGAESFLSS
jgi:hypothetical protein